MSCYRPHLALYLPGTEEASTFEAYASDGRLAQAIESTRRDLARLSQSLDWLEALQARREDGTAPQPPTP
ncbi:MULTISPECIES: hypothetical protein [Streptomyces]|uniref:hypothetical protein n=1 Tax=Streptomyces TaxID=1883 RepID=UPI0033C69031